MYSFIVLNWVTKWISAIVFMVFLQLTSVLTLNMEKPRLLLCLSELIHIFHTLIFRMSTLHLELWQMSLFECLLSLLLLLRRHYLQLMWNFINSHYHRFNFSSNNWTMLSALQHMWFLVTSFLNSWLIYPPIVRSFIFLLILHMKIILLRFNINVFFNLYLECPSLVKYKEKNYW